MHKAFYSVACACLFVLVGVTGCVHPVQEEIPPAEPEVFEVEPASDVTPTPTFLNRPPSEGPQIRTAPVTPVSKQELPPAVEGQESDKAIGAPATERNWPEPDELAGITRAHSMALQATGAAGLTWSDSLADQADLLARQETDAACRSTSASVRSYAGEAWLVTPPARSSDGELRPAPLHVRRIVEAFQAERAGPFGANAAGAATLGCSVNTCSNHTRYWYCLYR